MLRRIRFVVLVSTFIVGAPLAAHAETSPDASAYCGADVRPDKTKIPANLPALVVTRGSDANEIEVKSVAPSTTPELRFRAENEGANIVLLFPDRPFSVGTTYTIDLGVTCSRNPSNRPTLATFETIDPVPLPTSIGKVTTRLDEGRTTMTLEPSPELDAFRAVSTMEIAYGATKLTNRDWELPGHGVFNLRLYPEGDICSPDDDIVRERELVMRVHVYGAPNDPAPSTFTALFDCRKASRANVPADAGAPAEPSDTTSGGCQSASAAVGSAFLSGAVAMMVLGGLRRRRARKPQ